MKRNNFIWIFDEIKERHIFLGSMKSRVFKEAVLKIFGKNVSRSELYKKSISASEARALFEIESSCDEVWKNYYGEVIEKGFLSPLISLVGGLFPNGSATILLLVAYKIVDVRVKEFELVGDLPSAVKVFSERLKSFDSAALNGVSSFEQVRIALFNERLRVATQVAASLAWDLDREGYSDLGSYQKLFLPDSKNQKGFHKCPQRVFYELMADAILRIDGYVGFQRDIDLNIEDTFFVDEGEKKKYLSGAKKFSLEEYDSKLRRLWPSSYSDEIDKVMSSVLSVIIFMNLSQAIYEEVKRSTSPGLLGNEQLERRQYFQECLSDLQLNGGRYMERAKELIKEQMQASAP